MGYHEILVIIEYAHPLLSTPPFYSHSGTFSRTSGLNFGLSLHLHPYFVDSFIIVVPIVVFLFSVWSLFCCAELSAITSFAIISPGMREMAALHAF